MAIRLLIILVFIVSPIWGWITIWSNFTYFRFFGLSLITFVCFYIIVIDADRKIWTKEFWTR